MSLLDVFTPDQRKLLVALPYRVGLWISSSDSSGGDDASAAEMQVLTSILTGFSEDFCKSEFVQALMEETTARQSEWANWSGNLDAVPAECIRAADFMAAHVDLKCIHSFKMNLMEIALDVAMAYREDQGIQQKLFKSLSQIKSIFSASQPQAMPGFDNVSRAEKKALESLSQALGISIQVGA